jgi:hypothetical protein
MTRNHIAAPTLAVLLLLACGPKHQDSGANAGNESGAMSGGTGQMDTTSMPADTGTMRTDTAMPADTGTMRSDTAMSSSSSDTAATRSGTSSHDSAKANQTKSGVTNTETGKSTLGPGATKTRPDQGQPVTSKGDTINSNGQPNPTADSSSSH